tara:strand:- start:476 stop:643 length:168 start_codon:yes stop_codon:yes gene_type:complete
VTAAREATAAATTALEAAARVLAATAAKAVAERALAAWAVMRGMVETSVLSSWPS